MACRNNPALEPDPERARNGHLTIPNTFRVRLLQLDQSTSRVTQPYKRYHGGQSTRIARDDFSGYDAVRGKFLSARSSTYPVSSSLIPPDPCKKIPFPRAIFVRCAPPKSNWYKAS